MCMYGCGDANERGGMAGCRDSLLGFLTLWKNDSGNERDMGDI